MFFASADDNEINADLSTFCHRTEPLNRRLVSLYFSFLTSVCRGSRAILGEILWVCPCSRRGERLLTLAQSDAEVV